MDVQVQVAGQITSKPTSNGGTKFDVPLSNGMKATTFDVALATKVSQFGASPFTARIEQKPNPRGGAPYTNLIAAAGPGETLSPEIPTAGTPLGAAVAQPFVAGGVTGTGFSSSGPATPIVAAPAGGIDRFPPEVTTRNVKKDAIDIAYRLVSNLLQGAGIEALDDAVAQADSLAKKLYGDLRSHEQGQQAPAAPALAIEAPVAASPEAVAAFANEQSGATVVAVGTPTLEAALPWATA